MLNCKATEDCFYGGERCRKDSVVNFTGAKKDLPSYLVEIEEVKTIKTKTTKKED